jgi:hypothetical protein
LLRWGRGAHGHKYCCRQRDFPAPTRPCVLHSGSNSWVLHRSNDASCRDFEISH